eukprot:scaffold115312_cov14-Prasinocladus_malaysianus.AAC.2
MATERYALACYPCSEKVDLLRVAKSVRCALTIRMKAGLVTICAAMNLGMYEYVWTPSSVTMQRPWNGGSSGKNGKSSSSKSWRRAGGQTLLRKAVRRDAPDPHSIALTTTGMPSKCSKSG